MEFTRARCRVATNSRGSKSTPTSGIEFAGVEVQMDLPERQILLTGAAVGQLTRPGQRHWRDELATGHKLVDGEAHCDRVTVNQSLS